MAVHQNSLNNLRPSTKGMTNNPNGPGKSGYRCAKVRWKELLEVEGVKFVNPSTGQPTVGTVADALDAQLFKKAMIDGDLKALQYITDRIDGKPINEVHVYDKNRPIDNIVVTIMGASNTPSVLEADRLDALGLIESITPIED